MKIEILTNSQNFYLRVNQGAVVSNNSNTYIEINTDEINSNKLEIKGQTINLTNEKVCNIKDYILKELNTLTKLSLMQTPDFLSEYVLDGISKLLEVKIGNLHFIVNGAVSHFKTKESLDKIINKIEDILVR